MVEQLPSRTHLLRRGLRLEYFTVGWNVIEGIVAVGAGALAHSPALVGFGVDSFVESTSGSVLIWRLRRERTGEDDEESAERVERQAERLVGVAFLLLAAYVAFEAVRSLIGNEEPDSSVVGVVLTALSLVVMLWLGRAKKATGEALRSRALIADANQTFACWYLSFAALAGLGLNAWIGWWWADPVAALVICFILVKEGMEALRGGHDD